MLLNINNKIPVVTSLNSTIVRTINIYTPVTVCNQLSVNFMLSWSYSRDTCAVPIMLEGLTKQKKTLRSASHAALRLLRVVPNVYPLSRNACVWEPCASTITRRGCGDVAYVHKQWLYLKGPGHIGRHSESLSQASGWAVNHRPRTNVMLSA